MSSFLLFLELVVLVLGKKILEFILTGDGKFVQPSLLQWALVDNSRLLLKFGVLLKNSSTDWGVDVRGSLHTLHCSRRVSLFNLGSGFWKLNENDISQLLLETGTVFIFPVLDVSYRSKIRDSYCSNCLVHHDPFMLLGVESSRRSKSDGSTGSDGWKESGQEAHLYKKIDIVRKKTCKSTGRIG